MTNPNVLIIDDEPGVCYSFRRVVSKMGVEAISASTVADGLARFRRYRPDAVVLDLNLPDGSGLDAFRAIKRLRPECPVLFITAHGTTETALEAMKEGAFDYLIKPVDVARLTDLLGRALELAREGHPELPAADETGEERIIGRTPVMQETCKTIGLLAPQDVNVLILGESGTGKELVARSIWRHSPRAGRPFLAINCAAIPEALLESELFGHEKGAFTGADRQRLGKFEQCRDGTLFLDEIGDMSLPLQAKMLRVLQDQRFERIGGSETVRTCVRLLAATNQDLERRVAEGRFRADLYYRLKVTTVRVPPLRERADDIPALAEHFRMLANRRLGMRVRGFATETLELLRKHNWPGNVRELQSVISEAMVRTRGPEMLPEHLSDELRGPATTERVQAELDLTRIVDNLRGGVDVYGRVLRAVDRYVLVEVLRQTGGNQVRASEILGIDRKTLRQKLRALGLASPRSPQPDRADPVNPVLSAP